MSLELQEHCSLKPYNTFGIDVRARLLAHARDEADVREALALARERGLPLLVIGGGSNLLLTRDVEALVLRMASQGRRIVSDAADSVLVEAEAGEAWDPFVQWSLERGLAGLENLSLIPGTVGAAPMQNIGAYGVELKDVFDSLTALDRQDGTLREFDRQACRFGYRDSLFKQEPDRWLILRVRLRLTRRERLPGSGWLSAGGRSVEAGRRLAHRQGRLEGLSRWPGGGTRAAGAGPGQPWRCHRCPGPGIGGAYPGGRPSAFRRRIGA